MEKYVMPEASGIYRNWENNRNGFGEKSYKGVIIPLSVSTSEAISAFALGNGRGSVMINSCTNDKEVFGSSAPYLLALPKLEDVKKELETFNRFRTSLLPQLKEIEGVMDITLYATCDKTSKEVKIYIRGEDEVYDEVMPDVEIGGILNWDTLKDAKSWEEIAVNFVRQQEAGLVEDGKFNIALVSAAVANTKKLVVAGENMDKKEKALWSKLKNNKSLDERAKVEHFIEQKTAPNSKINAYNKDSNKNDLERV